MRAWLLYGALTLFLAFPLSVRPATSVMSVSPDTNLFLWTLAWDTHAFTHQPFGIFDANIYFPERYTLAYSENMIGSALFAAPVLWMTDNPVLAMNFVALLSCVLCGVGAYVLGRRLGMSTAGATLAGLIFAFSPPRFFRIGQLHLTTIQWVPFGLAFLHSYLDAGRRRDLQLAAAFFTLQALTSGHGAVFLTVAMLGLIVYRVAMGERLRLSARARDLGLSGAMVLLPTVLVLVPYFTVQREMGLRRSLENWAASWASFAASPSHLHAWALSLLPGRHPNEIADAFLFPGYVPLMLALVAVVWRPPNVVWRAPNARGESRAWQIRAWAILAVALESAMAIALVLAVWVTTFGPIRLRAGTTTLLAASSATRSWIVFVTSAGLRFAMVSRVPLALASRLRRFGGRAQRWRLARCGDAATFYGLLTLVSVWLAVGPPIGLWPLVYWLPGMNFIRVPSRFMMLAVLGLGVLAGIGFDRLTARLAPRQRAASAMVLA
ncbi:MAG: hypothetical protein HY655_13395, partial [Acidobacteria bacterium]|nr:hypothetical protein [Acidobacteriota bacterium]